MSLRNTLPFATVPEWLLDSDVSDRAVRLYGILIRHADKEGHAFPSRRVLAQRLRCSPDSVDRAVKELVRSGALEVAERLREDGSQTSNDYVLRPGGRTDAAGDGLTDAAGAGRTDAAPMNESQIEREPVERETPTRLRRRYTPEFEEFWAAYPAEGRHDKPKAADAFARALKRADRSEIVEGARRYRDDPNRELGKTKWAQGWLTGDRWNDPMLAASNGKRSVIADFLAEQEAVGG